MKQNVFYRREIFKLWEQLELNPRFQILNIAFYLDFETACSPYNKLFKLL